MMGETKPESRPLSPHLQVFRLMWTMTMSIVHRITGGALYFGMILLVWWLWAASYSDDYFAFAQTVLGSWLGLLVAFGFTWALIHHSLGGVRHLIWDMGRGMDLVTIEWMARGTLVGSTLLTVLVWAIGLGVWS